MSPRTGGAGLSSPQAAAVLDVSERTVKRVRAGEVGVKDAMTARAQEFLGRSRTTTGRDAELLDSYAAQVEWSALCAAFPNAHLTCLSSAIGRGWSSVHSRDCRQLTQSERMRQPTSWGGFALNWFPGHDLPWGVECRLGADETPYRVASAERTLLELADKEGAFGEDDVGEAY
ncbi:hypothetical protein N181_01900 [Sinorhizobium fredii USDA 205]|uniref:Uncharacterized protein n=1 Tax=Rhizobium fredii TaxID=380 RepID=A0A844AFF3_RHIFR|nr:hypothetical protein [Sinorhizobium fredii]KSV87378.1 hypothetical protein N181_01900 [Sinorhizobium fredii USDA 205]MQX11779.1 hypothetical protein [Sinorhizobium fredii]GEC31678.1 hypothetical protein EFR01_18490 [Sinorhizobium fredii]GLS09001.1 hypothetical protein GCM10007864_26310 [Sinorhizobium fredii]